MGRYNCWRDTGETVVGVCVSWECLCSIPELSAGSTEISTSLQHKSLTQSSQLDPQSVADK